MTRFVLVALIGLAPWAAAAQTVQQQAAALASPYLVPIPSAPHGSAGISPYGQYNQAPRYVDPAPPVYYVPPPAPAYAPAPNNYGQPSAVNGLPRTEYVNGYYRADGTYVQPYYRSR